MKTMTKTMFGFFCAILMATVSQAQETGETVLSNGLKYVGTPYVAHTLDVDGPEELILNCDEVDCTTFVEYVLAESLCLIDHILCFFWQVLICHRTSCDGSFGK